MVYDRVAGCGKAARRPPAAGRSCAAGCADEAPGQQARPAAESHALCAVCGSFLSTTVHLMLTCPKPGGTGPSRGAAGQCVLRLLLRISSYMLSSCLHTSTNGPHARLAALWPFSTNPQRPVPCCLAYCRPRLPGETGWSQAPEGAHVLTPVGRKQPVASAPASRKRRGHALLAAGPGLGPASAWGTVLSCQRCPAATRAPYACEAPQAGPACQRLLPWPHALWCSPTRQRCSAAAACARRPAWRPCRPPPRS